jgi:hypothetical protein
MTSIRGEAAPRRGNADVNFTSSKNKKIYAVNSADTNRR